MSVDIQASFTKKTKPRNGLEHIIKDLAEQPLLRRYAVVVYECPTTKVDNYNGGALTPVVKLVYIEPMLSGDEEDRARKLLERAYKARTGKLPDYEADAGQAELPFDDGSAPEGDGGE